MGRSGEELFECYGDGGVVSSGSEYVLWCKKRIDELETWDQVQNDGLESIETD